MKSQKLLFWMWLLPVFALIAYLGGLHQTVFQSGDQKRLLTASPTYFGDGPLRVAHVLSKKCGCSKRVARHLASRGPLSSAEEVIFQVGESLPNESELLEKGFQVVTLSGAELESQWGIQAVPLLQAQADGLTYNGGYQDYKSGEYRDLEVLESLKAQKQIEALPILGCASSEKLAQQIDPFGLKYPGEQQ